MYQCVISYLDIQHFLLFVLLSFYFLRVEDGKKEKKKLYLPLLLVDELRSRLNDFIVCKKKIEMSKITVLRFDKKYNEFDL